jgi:iron(III) transport system substrate-binding protein
MEGRTVVKRQMKRTRATTTLLLAVTLFAAGCGAGAEDTPSGAAAQPKGDAEWQKVVAAAKEEGTVTWYTMAPQAAQENLKKAFEDTYPEITVEVRSMGIAEMNSAIEAEHETGADGADVATSVDYSWIAAKAGEDWFANLTGPSVESPEWTGTDYLVDGQIMVAPLGLIVLGWNTSLYDKKIDSYEDLLDPKLGDGAIGVVRPEPALHADNWAFIEEHVDPDWIEKIAAQKPVVFPSAFALQEALAAGEVAVGSFVSATDMVGLQEKGAPVEFAVPNPAWAAQNQFFTLKSAAHPNAAQVFMDFFASPAGQLAAAKYGSSPLSKVAPETLGGESEVVLTNVDRVLQEDWGTEYLAKWRTAFDE